MSEIERANLDDAAGPKTFYLRTYGCQMNELDSQVMAGMLERRGLKQVSSEEEADLLLFNTCSVRDLAERKILGKLGRFKRTPLDEKPLIGITGCMASAKRELLLKKLPYIDFVLGTNNIQDLHWAIDEALKGRRAVFAEPQFTRELEYLSAKREDKVKAYVSISRGCSKCCTYCVVPHTRGREVSRPPSHILEECRQLADRGYREIMLLGQNVNSYGKDHPEWSFLFHDLLAKIDAIPGLARVRFMTSHPVDITRELMEALRDLPSLCRLVHFPFQSGSNAILRKMHRMYTIEEYLDKVTQLRSLVPDVALGTDVIVGFCGETEEDFLSTKRLLEQLRFSLAFLFAYSPRQGTPAFRWKDDVSLQEKERRLRELLLLQEKVVAEQRQAMVGKTVEVLVEEVNFKEERLLKGRTRCWKNVLFPASPELIGTLQHVRLHSYSHQTLLGTLSTHIDEQRSP